jgi:hypothetical protein
MRTKTSPFTPRIIQIIQSSFKKGASVAQITAKVNASATAKKLGKSFSMPSIRAAVGNLTRGAALRV